MNAPFSFSLTAVAPIWFPAVAWWVIPGVAVARLIVLGYNGSMQQVVSGQEADLTIIYVPCGSEEEAATIARTLLEERLIACANIYPSRSLYVWEDELKDESEYLLLCKTAPSRGYAAERRIAMLHSYEIPCILSFSPASVNRAYVSWVREQVTSSHAVPKPGDKANAETAG